MSLPAGVRNLRAVPGGDVNEAFRVVLADGREAFVKTRADAPPGEYAAEAAGLEWLADANALRVPRVLDVSDEHLALEWIEPGRLSVGGAEELGHGLASVHAAGAPRFGRFDGTSDAGWLGSLRVSNAPSESWSEFYAERRLRPLNRLAAERGLLSRSGASALDRVCDRIEQLCGPPEPPARLHGDLWSGNVLADRDGRPWLIDAAAYGGHREVDLAMLALFGAPPGTPEAYRERAPLADGWEQRVGLYQLLPLLVHALLFGGGYVASVERTAARYV
ncbi:MAG TPA: fructosamine kinase family protein [Solirubrobacteraceae bacterium]|nr:fructosamine kinase family protein [Solirubrobacteraceae bacterium]